MPALVASAESRLQLMSAAQSLASSVCQGKGSGVPSCAEKLCCALRQGLCSAGLLLRSLA